jgi:hypothetical protein
MTAGDISLIGQGEPFVQAVGLDVSGCGAEARRPGGESAGRASLKWAV